jgi:hypothetical protein
LGGNVRTVTRNKESSVAASKETGLEMNADRLGTWSCLEIRMQDQVFERVEIFEKNLNKSILYSGGN